MKTEKFHFGQKARQEKAAKLLGLNYSEVNSFQKEAPKLLGAPSYTFRGPMCYKSGGKVREVSIEVQFLKPSKKDSTKSDCGYAKPIKRAMGGLLGSHASESKSCLKKGGMLKNLHSNKIMKLLAPKPKGGLSAAPHKGPKKPSHMASNGFHTHSANPFKFLRDK
jgi:hypothetical protein